MKLRTPLKIKLARYAISCTECGFTWSTVAPRSLGDRAFDKAKRRHTRMHGMHRTKNAKKR